MLSVLYILHSLRFVIPEAIMLGVAPQYLVMWMSWRAVSCVLPRRTYERGDEIMYDMYQSLICFFFETYTGAEVQFECLIMSQQLVNLCMSHDGVGGGLGGVVGGV